MNYAALLQAALTYAAQQKGAALTQQEVDLLRQQLANEQNVPLPQIPEMQAEQLGPSAVGSMSPDEGTRSKQLSAISELQNMIDQGGLNYADKSELDQATSAAANQQRRAQAGVAADAAARGQLNGGNRLLMDMNAAQEGANAARSTGLAVAAQAQQRRIQAIQDAAAQESQLRGEDWSEKEQAAAAKDQRDQLNEAAREKAQYYNAGIPQQEFNNAWAKASGASGAVNSLAGGINNQANQGRADAATAVNAIGAASTPQPSQTSTYNPDPNTLSTLANNPYPETPPNQPTNPDDWKNPFT